MIIFLEATNMIIKRLEIKNLFMLKMWEKNMNMKKYLKTL